MKPRVFQHRGERELLILDNRDSFVFNLAHRLFEIGCTDVSVIRSDTVTAAQVEAMRPRAVVLSPGPGGPDDAGCCVEVVRRLSGSIPLLGVCLGHQAIARAFGGTVARSGSPTHGKASPIHHAGSRLMPDLPSPFLAGRYHSLTVLEPLPEPLLRVAWSGDLVMALEHRHHDTFGVQFHPESILSPSGYEILRRFADIIPGR